MNASKHTNEGIASIIFGIIGIVMMYESIKDRNLSVSNVEAVRKLEKLREQTQEFGKSLDKK